MRKPEQHDTHEPKQDANTPTAFDRVMQWRSWILLLMLAYAIVALPLFLMPGPIICCDWPCWWSAVTEFDAHVLPDQHRVTNIVFPTIHAGRIFGSAYSLALVLPWLLSQIFSVAVALKIVYLISIEVIAITVYFICRTWAERYESVLASLLATLAFLEPIRNGMWYSAFAFGAIWLCGLVAIQMIRKPKWYSWLLLTGLMTFIIYTHSLKMVSVVSLLLGASIYLMLFQRSRASFWVVVSFGAAVLTSILLAAPQLVSATSSSASIGQLDPMNFTGGLAKALWVLATLSLVATPGFIVLYRKNRLVFFMVVPVAVSGIAMMLNLAAIFPEWFPGRSGLIIFSERFVYTVRAVILIGCAGSFVCLMSRLVDQDERDPKTGNPNKLSIGVFAFFYSFILLFAGSFLVHMTPYLTLGTIPGASDYQAMTQWVKANGSRNGPRFYCEGLYGIYCLDPDDVTGETRYTTHLLGFVSGMADVAQVDGVWMAKSDKTLPCTLHGREPNLFNIPSAKLQPEALRQAMRRINCGSIITATRASCQAMERLSRFEKAFESGRFAVFRDPTFVSRYAYRVQEPETPLPVEMLATDHWAIDVSGHADDDADNTIRDRENIERDTPNHGVIVSLAYNPNWQATLDGQSLDISEHDGLIRIAMAPGTVSPGTAGQITDGRISLRYVVDQRKPLTVAAAGLILALICCIAFPRLIVASNAPPTALPE